ncbi:MAG: HD domain-containing protein [Deltaproteobacteria bacterium]|nr:HD domain-containing protein [Deltaproteobacteria bacterium]NIS76378.1 HD domain-containing protein [Deltaproteobacteria bacterium]
MAPERRRAKREQYRIQAVRDLTRGIPREGEFVSSLKFALRSVLGALTVSRGAIVTYNEWDVEYVVARGFTVDEKKLALRGHLQSYFTGRDTSFSLLNPRIKADVREYFTSLTPKAEDVVFVSPIKGGRRFFGFIMLGMKINGEHPARRDLELLNVMTHYLAAEIHSRRVIVDVAGLNMSLSAKVKENVKLISSLRSVYFQTIRALAAAIDAKDPYTRGHSERVAKISREIAKTMRLEEDSVNAIYMASILHDIGKIATEEKILAKKGTLTGLEKSRVKNHPKVSYKILSKVKFPDPNIALFALYHHEWVNGEGYPYGIQGEEIPLGARIIALADAFDAMVADRPYRRGKNLRESVKEVVECSGTQFDPKVTSAFLEVLKSEVEDGMRRPVITPIIKNGDVGKQDLPYIKKSLGRVRRISRL